jgi:hypothetical protein
MPLTALAQSGVVGSLKVTKSIPRVTSDNRITVLITIENNGSVPIYDLQVFEYFNTNLRAEGSALLTQPSGKSEISLAATEVATRVQVIIDPPRPNLLMPGEKLTIEYTQYSPRGGDFTLPPALTWFSYQFDRSTVRLSFYSNGLIVHVPNEFEKAFLTVYPYVLSATAFTTTFTILLWARKRLKTLRKNLTP